MSGKKYRAASILLFVVFLVCLVSVPLLAKEYEIASYDIQMDLNQEGNYHVTEKITYDFKEGSFSKGYREISARGFEGLEFVSIRGLDRQITDYSVEDDRELVINWDFPPTTGQATFLISYRALAALESKDGRNVIDWNPVGSDWQVPIRELDIEINLPQSVSGLEIAPEEDLVSNENNRKVTFHYSNLPAETYYHLILSFDEIIAMEAEKPSRQLFWSVLIGLMLGIILAGIDVYSGIKNRPEPGVSPLKPESLSFLKIAGIYHSDYTRKKGGLTAEVFSLAMERKIKLVSKPKKGFLNSKKVDVEVKVISEENLTEEEKIIIEGLKDHENLKEFSRDYKFFKRVLNDVKTSLKDDGLISETSLSIKKRLYFTALLIFIPGLAGFIYGLTASWGAVLGTGMALLVWSIGRFIRGALYPALSKDGLGLRDNISRLLDEKKETLDDLIEQNPAGALEFFFDQLPYITLHRRFTAYAFNKYKKVFRKAEEFDLPPWIEFDLSELDTTLDALEVVEVIDYVLVSTIFVAASTGAATGAGAGAPGSGAGGGGGGAA